VSTCIVIPARMASTRFPGKPLVDLIGKPMIQWVYEAAVASGIAAEVVVATPDAEILAACERFGARAVETRLDHPSGTDRIQEVAQNLSTDIYLNVQGDEPLVPVEAIRALNAAMVESGNDVGSLYDEAQPDEVDDPAVVKVVLDAKQQALYFSRSAIPFARNGQPTYWRHIGMYAYRRAALDAFVETGPSLLEVTEGLEQLRFLELGFRIQMVRAAAGATAVDTKEQAEIVRQILAERGL
jgi:3-deoxy-D-manno-octulosonate cytidylyltransferase